MLLEIKKYLEKNNSANITELALHCHTSPETMQSLLKHWERKGKIAKCEKPNGCGSKCQMCKSQFAEVYQWSS